ncbi:hypothetical protein HN51_058422 [Arachis hypogaea]
MKVKYYKRMERSSGMNLFLTQNPHHSKFSVTWQMKKRNVKLMLIVVERMLLEVIEILLRKGKPSKTVSGKKNLPDTAKPSLPAKKRVQVPQDPLSETPFKNSSSGDSLCGTRKEGKEKDTDTANENPLQSERDDEVQNKTSFDLFDSELFEWTQRPCSPELFSSPVKLQPLSAGVISENQEDLLEASKELERNKSSDYAENTKLQNSQKETRLSDVQCDFTI